MSQTRTIRPVQLSCAFTIIWAHIQNTQTTGILAVQLWICKEQRLLSSSVLRVWTNLHGFATYASFSKSSPCFYTTLTVYSDSSRPGESSGETFKKICSVVTVGGREKQVFVWLKVLLNVLLFWTHISNLTNMGIIAYRSRDLHL